MHISESTVHGRAGPTPKSRDLFSFAYRPVTGLVLESENPAKFRDIVSSAGPEVPFVNELGSTGSHWVYHHLEQRRERYRTDCPVNIYP